MCVAIFTNLLNLVMDGILRKIRDDEPKIRKIQGPYFYMLHGHTFSLDMGYLAEKSVFVSRLA